MCCRCISALHAHWQRPAGAVPLGLRGVFRGRHRHCGGRPAPDAQPAGNHLRPRHGRRRGHQPAAVLQRRHRRRGLGILFVVPVGADGAAGRQPRFLRAGGAGHLALLGQQVAAYLVDRRAQLRLHWRGHLRRHRVPGGAAGNWPLASRLRDTEAAVRRQQVDRRISRNCRSTSCRTCARASWWWTTRTASA